MQPAVYALLGSLIGGFIAGSVSFLVAWQTRKAAEQAWVRDNRREIYDRFLTQGQALLIALVEPLPEPSADELHNAYVGFMGAYVVVQAVAERAVVDAARNYGYELGKLKQRIDAGSTDAGNVAARVRLYRQEAIDAMRLELGQTGTAKPLEGEA
jgi:hypothetical protein